MNASVFSKAYYYFFSFSYFCYGFFGFGKKKFFMQPVTAHA